MLPRPDRILEPLSAGAAPPQKMRARAMADASQIQREMLELLRVAGDARGGKASVCSAPGHRSYRGDPRWDSGTGRLRTPYTQPRTSRDRHAENRSWEPTVTDFDWPPRERSGGGKPADRADPVIALDREGGSRSAADNAGSRKAYDVEPEEHERTEIVCLSSDESALDAFASESGIGDVAEPWPSTDRPAVLFTTEPVQNERPLRDERLLGDERAVRDEIPLRIETIRVDSIQSIPDAANEPIRHYAIDPVTDVAIEPMPQYVQRGSARRPKTSLLGRSAVFAALAIGVAGGGVGGLYLRRNPIGLAIVRIPVLDETTQGTRVVQPPQIASPPQNGDVARQR